MAPCPCEACPSRPPAGAAGLWNVRDEAEYGTLTVADSGTRSDEHPVGENRDPAVGWELSFIVALAAQDRLLGRLVYRGAWQGAALALTVDAWDANRGGRVFIPWPFFRLSFVSALSPAVPANHTVTYHARPWRADRPVLGQTSLYGRSLVSVVAGGTTSTAVPAGATHYYVAPNSGGAGFAVEEAATPSGGSEQAWDAYTLDPLASYSAGLSAPEGWRRVPPAVSTTVVRIVNLDAINARKLAIHWRYDLGGLL